MVDYASLFGWLLVTSLLLLSWWSLCIWIFESPVPVMFTGSDIRQGKWRTVGLGGIFGLTVLVLEVILVHLWVMIEGVALMLIALWILCSLVGMVIELTLFTGQRHPVIEWLHNALRNIFAYGFMMCVVLQLAGLISMWNAL